MLHNLFIWFYKKIKIKIPIRYINKTHPRLKKISVGDWIDLYSAKDYKYKAGENLLVNLGFSMQLPEKYEAYVLPRGSSFKNYSFIQTNSKGVVDNSYRGNNDVWFLPIYALRDGEIKKGDRVCQMRIQLSMPTIILEEKDSFEDSDRGGYGSTGKQ